MDRTAVALVLCVVLAGCSGVTGIDESTETVTPAPVQTAESVQTTEQDPLPPGVTGSAVADLDRLARAHVTATDGTAYTWRSEYVSARFLENETLESEIRQRARVENESRYSYWTNRRQADSNRAFSYLGNYTAHAGPDGRYTRFEDGNRLVYEEVPHRPARITVGENARSAIREYLAVENATVAVTLVDGERHYEITGSDYALPTAWEIENYSVTGVVSPEGFVRSLDVQYVRTLNHEREAIRYSFAYTQVGETTVERPRWVSERWPTGDGSSTATTTP